MKKVIIASLALASASASLFAQDSFVAGWDFDDVAANATSAFANWGDLDGFATASWTHSPANPPIVFTSEFAIDGTGNSAVVGNDFAFVDPNTGFDQFTDGPNAAEQGFRSFSNDDTFTLNFDASLYTDLQLTYALNNGSGFTLVTEDLSALNGNAAASFVIASGNGVSIDNIAITGTAVPEPSTYAAIAGALALGFVAYRRRK